MAEAEVSSGIARIVRAGDRDRYFASLFAPAPKRSALFALHAYDLTLLDVLRTTTEVQIGLIRLAWWRDAVTAMRDRPIAGQPVLAALAAEALEPAPLAALAEAYMDRLEGAGLGATGATLFGIAGRLLGGVDGECAAAGQYWSAAGDRRLGEAAAEPEIPSARRTPAIRPITALAAVSRRDFAGKHEPRGSIGRQLTMLRHMLTGRV